MDLQRLRLAAGWRALQREQIALMDALAASARYAGEQERRLRDEVAAEREASEHQRLADAELVRRPGRKARAA